MTSEQQQPPHKQTLSAPPPGHVSLRLQVEKKAEQGPPRISEDMHEVTVTFDLLLQHIRDRVNIYEFQTPPTHLHAPPHAAALPHNNRDPPPRHNARCFLGFINASTQNSNNAEHVPNETHNGSVSLHGDTFLKVHFSPHLVYDKTPGSKEQLLNFSLSKHQKIKI